MNTFKISNIDCTKCAADIESALLKSGKVKTASVNINSSTLVTDSGDLDFIRETVKRVYPDVKITAPSSDSGSNVTFRQEHWTEIVRFIIASVLFACSIILDNFSEVPWYVIHTTFLLSYLISGWSVLRKALTNLINGKVFDENFLMTIATLGAVAIGELAEATAVMLFYNIGEFFQGFAVHRSRRSIRALMAIRPDQANLIHNDTIKSVHPEDLKINDLVLVKPGEKVPVDGIITEGNSFIDSYPLTGESVPRSVTTGDTILAGMINNSGLLKLRVTKLFTESSVAKIMELVESAQNKKARTERFMTTFARYYTPPVVLLALLIAVLPPLLFGYAYTDWIYRALVILVISCPCALVISIPLGYFGGIGGSSRNGILVKGSNFLDVLSGAHTIVFDKTGTLTEGSFKVAEIVPKNDFNESEVLQAASLAESHSNHPIAVSIREAAGKEYSDHLSDINEFRGEGVLATTGDTRILAGNDKLMHRFNVKHEECEIPGTIVHIAINDQYAGYIVISDIERKEAIQALDSLRSKGINNIVMLTGDNRSVAEAISAKLKIDKYHAQLLPENKVEIIEKIKSSLKPGQKLIFVGDGINDAPALAVSDAGIAMGALGSDAAVESADVVIMSDDLRKVPMAISIAKKTRTIVWQNIFFALGIKILFLALGSLGLASMWEAVFADMGVALIAIMNAVRVLRA